MTFGKACLTSVLVLAVATPALAQVTYRHGGSAYGSRQAVPLNPDDDMSYATHPSFQIIETPYGPQTRVIYRCAFPNGWNAADAVRDFNGIPLGVDHTCPDATDSNGVRARY